MLSEQARERLSRAKPSYNHCAVCGRVPKSDEEANLAPVRWWNPDDGWMIGTICRWCAEDVVDFEPEPDDFAFSRTNGVADIMNTDEDPIIALEGI